MGCGAHGEDGHALALDAHDLPPWAAVYQQAQRCLAAGCFEALVDDLRSVLRLVARRDSEPSAVAFACLMLKHGAATAAGP